MPQKKGNGGYGLEQYNPNDGKYVEDGIPNKSYDNPDEKILNSLGLELDDLEDELDFDFEIINDEIEKELGIENYNDEYVPEDELEDETEEIEEDFFHFPVQTVQKIEKIRENGKVLFYSNDILKKKILENSSKFHLDYSKAFIYTISPQEFLELTTRGKGIFIIEEETKNFNIPKRLENDELSEIIYKEPLFLEVDLQTGKVTGHEGRHRMFALMKNGYTNVQIEIFPTNKNFDKYNTNEINIKNFKGQFKNINIPTMENLQPLSINNMDNLEEVISDLEAKKEKSETLKFSENEINKLKQTGNLEMYDIQEVDLESLVKQLGLDNPEHGTFSRRREVWGLTPSEYIFDRNKMNYYSPIRLRGENGNYKVIDGNHRLWALYNSGYKKADVLVEKNKEQKNAMKYFNTGDE